MPVYELKIEVPMACIEQLEELLMELEEQGLMVLEDKPSAKSWLSGYFQTPDEATVSWKRLLVAASAVNLTLGIPRVHELADADWKNSYKAHFKASKFGNLNWVPVWEREVFALPAGEAVLWLDPGMAFGTGNHETTRLCCARLAEFTGTVGTAGRVIDAGCGSGILALSAAKLGFLQIYGFDNDAEAIRISEENALLNDLRGEAVFAVADLITGLAGRKAELVMANIQADVLMKFARELVDSVSPGGELVLSGILAIELEQVKAVFAVIESNWLAESRTLGEWSDLRLRQRS